MKEIFNLLFNQDNVIKLRGSACESPSIDKGCKDLLERNS